MIRQLRHKFIAISMLSVFIVLFMLIGLINYTNYHNINQSLDLRLDLLEENDGNLEIHDKRGLPPHERDGLPPLPPSDDERHEDTQSLRDDERVPDGSFLDDYMHWEHSLFSFHNDLSEEAFFDTRYFTVTIDEDGTVVDVNADFIASITEEDAAEIGLSLYNKKQTDGFFDNYKFRAVSITDGDGAPATMYLFLNAGRELNTFHNFLFASILVCIIGMSLIFVLVVVLSKIPLRPVIQSYEKQKRFITDASHEIKTPLAIIEANTEVIEMEAGESEWTRSIRNQISRLSSLTEKLVFLSRMDEENTKLALVELDLSSLVEEATEGYSGVARSSGHKLVLSITSGLTLQGDKAMLTQLISLLMDNAMKYASDGSDIRLYLEPRHKGRHTIRLTTENGVDEMTPGNQDVLFERFYRDDPSRNSDTGGHGIGLSVAAAIVHAHNGTIHAESPDGHSIRFIINL